MIINVGDKSANFLKKSDTTATSSGDISVLLCAISPPIYTTELSGSFLKKS